MTSYRLLSSTIELVGLTFRAKHGVLPHEQAFPQTFVVDCTMTVNVQAAARSDDVADTVNYAAVSEVIGKHVVQMGSCKLIERLAFEIATAILNDFPTVEEIALTLHKPQAPIGEVAQDVAIKVVLGR